MSSLARPLLVVVVLLSLVAPAGAAATAPTETAFERDATTPVPAATTSARHATTSAPTAATEETIDVTTRLSLTPDVPGAVRVTVEFRVPDGVVNFTTRIPRSATLRSASGFERQNETDFLWTGERRPATITYSLPVNQTTQTSGPGYLPERSRAFRDGSAAFQDGSETGYLFVDVGEWALVSRPSVPLYDVWVRGSTSVSVSRTLTVGGDGAAGQRIAFLGDVQTHVRETNGQRFRLVVPEAASLAESTDDLFDALGNASRRLRVGARDETVFLVAAPTTVEWGVIGLEAGGTDAWVRADEPLNVTNSGWLHEYVHTRQDYRASSSVRWFTEGGATYYATLLALQQRRISFRRFRDFLARGRHRDGSAVLADPATWNGTANYLKGALVVSHLDRRIREASGGSRTFQSVFASMNAAEGEVTQSDFLNYVADAGNRSIRDAAATYTEGTDAPPVVTAEQYQEAFGSVSVEVTYGFASTRPFSVVGPYREGPVDARPITLVPDERLRIRSLVRNQGSTAADYNATLWLDGRRLSSQTGRIGPNEETTVTTTKTFESRGEYTLRSGEETVTVRVVDPATVRVVDLRLDRVRLDAPGTVTATATVRNSASLPALGTLTFTRDGEPVATQSVSVPPGGEGVVTQRVTLPAPGEYTIGLANRSATATVAVETTTTTGSPETPAKTDSDATPTPADATPTASGPGFGVAATMVALAAALLVLSNGDA